MSTVYRKELAFSTHHQLAKTWATELSEERHLSAWGLGYKCPPSVADSEPPPHLLKCLPEREILSKCICGRRLLTHKAKELESCELLTGECPASIPGSSKWGFLCWSTHSWLQFSRGRQMFHQPWRALTDSGPPSAFRKPHGHRTHVWSSNVFFSFLFWIDIILHTAWT